MEKRLPSTQLRKTGISKHLALGDRDPFVRTVNKREFHLVAISLRFFQFFDLRL